MRRTGLSRLRLRSRADGITFVFAIVALAVLLILGLVMVRMGINDVKQAGVYKRRMQTMQLAEGALERCIWMMEADANGRDDINKKLRGGTGGEGEIPGDGIVRVYYSPVWATPAGAHYWFRASYPHQNTDNLALVLAGSRAPNGEQEYVRAVLRYLPFKAAVFGHALFSDHNLTIKGNVSVDGNPEALCAHGHEVYPPLPLNELCPICNPNLPLVVDDPTGIIVEEGGEGIYATGNITFDGTPAISGNIKATGSIENPPPPDPPDALQEPNSERIPFPEIDLEWYRTNADVVYTANKTTLNGGTLGTWADPMIIFAEGEVDISGTFSGVGIIVSAKGFKVTGSIEYTDSGNGLALLTTGNFKIAGTADVYGLIYAHSVEAEAEFVGAGTARIMGAVAADVINAGVGTLEVSYDRRLKNMDNLPGNEGQVAICSWQVQ